MNSASHPADLPSDEHEDQRPSKSQRKREMHARQDLGARLVELGAEDLARLALPENLREAVGAAQRIRSHEARRRQLQYIGRLMREVDAAALQADYDRVKGRSRAAVGLMHQSERLRDELLADDAALARFVEQYPGQDLQWLRAKLRAARQEREQSRAPRHARELYKWLYALLESESRGTPPPPAP